MEKKVTECWVGLVWPAMRFQEGNESSAWRAKRKLFRRTGKWCSSKFWNYEGQCICSIVAGRREVFHGRVTSLRKGCGVGIKMCWGPKRGDLIKEMKIIQCGPPSLLPQLNSAEGGRANTGEGSPLRDRNSANPAFLAVLPGAKSSGSPRSEVPDQADGELPGGRTRYPGSSLLFGILASFNLHNPA